MKYHHRAYFQHGFCKHYLDGSGEVKTVAPFFLKWFLRLFGDVCRER